MKHLDLFSGIGGFSLAASWVWGCEHEIVGFVEMDKFCQKVLNKHWPNVPIHSDIKDFKYAGTNVDLLTGGFPCQPFSLAGNRRGAEDDRFIWPEMLRVIREVRPAWIIGENVAGIVNMGLEQVLSDLESTEYEVQAFLIPACGVDAPHQRDRIWIVANTNCKRLQYTQERQSKACFFSGASSLSRVWKPEPNVGRVANGIPRRVDRLRSLGNAIVPQVVMPIMQAIKQLS